MGWKVNLIIFPTSTHGLSYLLGIKSYSYLFWWSELVVRSDLVLFWVRSGALSSCVHLSTTNVEYLGSITSLEVIKAQSVRNKFTCSCSFLARRLVSGSWFVSLMLDGEFLTFEVSCTVGMSSSVAAAAECHCGAAVLDGSLAAWLYVRGEARKFGRWCQCRVLNTYYW